MQTAWRKAIRDLTCQRSRTLFVVLAVALGVAGFTAVLSAYAILKRELNAGYLATNPASAIFRMDRVNGQTIQAVLATGQVEGAEARGTVNARIKAGPAQWRPLVLFIVQDYADIRINRLLPQEGAWPPAKGEILIERDAMPVIRARIGETATVRNSDGAERTLRISGTVHDVGQAQARMENVVYAYTNIATMEELSDGPFLDQLLIVVSGDRFDERHIRSVANEVTKALETHGLTPRRVDIPAPGKHPHADIMGFLLLAMSAFGLCILGLTGILVVNLISGLMAAQTPQIGVMKAIGGSPTQIGRIYLLQAAFMGLSAVAAGIVPGILGGRALCRYMSLFLNFDINSMSAPVWVFALVCAVGIAVPLIAAAFPVSRACAVTVGAALANTGAATEAFSRSSIDLMLTGPARSNRPLLLALRDGLRRRTRFLLTVITLAAGGLFFMSALNIRASLVNTLDRMFHARRYDLTLSLAGMQPLDKAERAVRMTSGIVRFEGWMMLEAAFAGDAKPAPAGGHVIHPGTPNEKTFSAVALPPQSSIFEFTYISGHGFSAKGADEMVVNSALAARYPQAKPGSTIPVQLGPARLELTVAGIVREPFAPPAAYFSRPWLEAKGHHGALANSLRLALKSTDEQSLDSVRAALERNLAAEGIRVTGSSTTAEGRYGFDQHMVMIYVFLVIVSCILAAVGGLGLATTLSLNVMERRREMAVLRAIGATPRTVYMLILVEGLVTSLLAWAIAASAVWPVSRWLSNMLVMAMFRSDLDFRFEPKGLEIWLLVSLGLGAAASMLPAWRASTLTIREALAAS